MRYTSKRLPFVDRREKYPPDERLTKTRLPLVAGTAAYRLGCFAVIALVIGCGLAFRKDASDFLLHRLTLVRHLPESASTHNDVVYVLGGTPDSLKAKFQTALDSLRFGIFLAIPVMMASAIAIANRDERTSQDSWAGPATCFSLTCSFQFGNLSASTFSKLQWNW